MTGRSDTPVSADAAKAIAIAGLAAQLRVEPVDRLSAPAYDIVESEWFLFYVPGPVAQVGASHHVAVHRQTGEFRDLGRLGE